MKADMCQSVFARLFSIASRAELLPSRGAPLLFGELLLNPYEALFQCVAEDTCSHIASMTSARTWTADLLFGRHPFTDSGPSFDAGLIPPMWRLFSIPLRDLLPLKGPKKSDLCV